MQLALSILQPISAALLVLLILIQQKGTGLSAAFVGTGGFHSTKRGAEKVIAMSTNVLFVAFLALSFLASVV